MMQHQDLLIEIGLEELPAHGQQQLAQRFALLFQTALKAEQITVSSVMPFVTPRRLALIATGVSAAQPKQQIEKQGPLVAKAFDEKGNPSQACTGFARSCGVSVDALMRMDTPKGEKLIYRCVRDGATLQTILQSILPDILKKLPSGKTMTWGVGDHRFIRPVHHLVVIYGKRVLPLEIMGCQASNVTVGHRFLASDPIVIKSVDSYERQLYKGHVIVSFDKRQEAIHAQFASLLPKKHEVAIENRLLDEVTGLVEWPRVCVGRFDEAFLSLPAEVICQSMSKHQKCFAVMHEGQLTAQFVLVSNLDSKSMQRVIEGNERVMRARLSDALFFYEQDKKTGLTDFASQLAHVVFHRKLGTIEDKINRVLVLVTHYAKALSMDAALAKQAVLLQKADLMSAMVGEFPELQGVMGGYYAHEEGLDQRVVDGIRWQYYPRFSGDTLPSSPLGILCSMMDKLDTIVALFAVGEPPTGEKDPFGLRRAALGVVRMLVEKQLGFDLQELITLACQSLEKQGIAVEDNTRETIQQFFYDRMKAWYLEQGIGQDTFHAVLRVMPTVLLDCHNRLQAVQAFKQHPLAPTLAMLNKRVKNILKNEQYSCDYRESVLALDAEKALSKSLKTKQDEIQPMLDERQYSAVLTSLASLESTINAFFDQVMVKVEDPTLKQARLGLLASVRALFLSVADISELVLE